MMEASERIKNSLLTEHFGYTPLALFDDILNTVNELVFQAIGGVEETLTCSEIANLGFSHENFEQQLKASPGQTIDDIAKTEINNGMIKLETLLNATVDTSFDKLELYAHRNLLNVTNREQEAGLEYWVQLDHYKNLQIDQDAQPIDQQELQLLRRKLQETQKLNALLSEEVARNEALLAELRPFAVTRDTNGRDDDERGLPDLTFLSKNAVPTEMGLARESLNNKLSQHAQFLMPRIAAIQTLLDSTRTQLTDTHIPSVTEAAKQRQAYLQQQVKDAMSRAKVLSTTHVLDSHGVATDDDLSALENLAANLKALNE